MYSFIYILRYFYVKMLVPASIYKIELVAGEPNKNTYIFDSAFPVKSKLCTMLM